MPLLGRCAACGKPFQLLPESVGRPVECPACKVVGIAQLLGDLPGANAPTRIPSTPPPPLPAPQAVTGPQPGISTSPTSATQPVAASAPPSILGQLLLTAILTAIAVGAVIVVYRFGSGTVSDSAWESLALNDRIRVEVPGTASPKPLPAPSDPRIATQQSWQVESWFAGLRVQITLLTLAPGDEGAFDFDVYTRREMQSRPGELGGQELQHGSVRLGNYSGTEFVIQSPEGIWVERILAIPPIPSHPAPAIVRIAIQGANLTAEHPTVVRLMASLKVNP
ncbi:hypothetical protein [Tuwongella immobilis]|uniref:Uncharacterized protein n=1 Tax=Tuwongella immobilis TaxID=692036 RepID=A0A6C2YY90_9BACT|nr:hypothetical protein [Tuwongella immobilis]VIP05742.1 unnamed protein product [Tuwongella immobilis]VTS08840.1 unnamed protein product [Tuwongella immobilis]